jgi:hypothetical protein
VVTGEFDFGTFLCWKRPRCIILTIILRFESTGRLQRIVAKMSVRPLWTAALPGRPLKHASGIGDWYVRGSEGLVLGIDPGRGEGNRHHEVRQVIVEIAIVCKTIANTERVIPLLPG